MVRNRTQTGSTLANFHEAGRSEYLAHYVFSSLGTSVPVPRQEDTGLDLYCTLTRRIGQRIWPEAYFSVQVKSTMNSWTFDSQESVKWLIQHPLPLFLCVVLKKQALLRVYQTTPRFYAWSLPPLPERLILKPGQRGDGHPPEWIDGTTFSLSAPILEFSVQDALGDGFLESAKATLKMWVDVDMENLHRLRNGVRSFKVPANYRTGECEINGWAIQGINRAERETVAEGVASLRDSLDWVSGQLYKGGDLPGAIRGMLLLRHLYWDDFHSPASLCNGPDILKVLGRGSSGWLNRFVDELGSEIDYPLVRDVRDTTKLSSVTRLYLGNSPITDDELAALSAAIELRYLFLGGTRVGNKGLARLAALRRLRELFLNGTQITQAGLVHLKGLSELNTLSLSDTKIDDKGLRHLKPLTKLENLYLNNTRITATGISSLTGLPRLDVLTLIGTSVDDTALGRLKQWRSLRRLDIANTRITARGIDDFATERPDVAVVR